jgi:hypothetical protein
MVTRGTLRRVASLWIILLMAISLQPFRPWKTNDSPSPLHRVAHVTTFGVAGLMLLALSRNRPEERRVCLGVVVLAVFIETAQHLIYKVLFEWWDVREDMIGLLIAVMLIRFTPVRSLLLAGD